MITNRGEAPLNDQNPVMGEVDGKKIYTTSYVGFPRTELKLADDDYAGERERAMTRNTDQGVMPMTQEEQDAERALTYTLIKKFTMNIFKLDFTRFSFPVGYSEQRTFLERTADLFTFIADKYADLMYECGVPEQRLQYLATGIIAGFHIYLQSKKPWNPVLGETYVGKWPNGAVIYGEQTSHHPPVSDFQIIGPDDKWKCIAHCNFSISSGITQVDVLQHGTFKLEFDDGTEYEWEFPTISVLGIIKGDRIVTVKGPLEVEDKTNELKCVVEIGPKPDRSKGITKERKTTLYGGILSPDGTKIFNKITGDYCNEVYCDGEVYWNLEEDIAHRPIADVTDDELLPSDCRFRIDRMYLIKGDLDEADKAKVIIEESQRREEKLRDCVNK